MMPTQNQNLEFRSSKANLSTPSNSPETREKIKKNKYSYLDVWTFFEQYLFFRRKKGKIAQNFLNGRDLV